MPIVAVTGILKPSFSRKPHESFSFIDFSVFDNWAYKDHNNLKGQNKSEKLHSIHTGILLGIGSANERKRYYVTAYLIGQAYTQNDTCRCVPHGDTLQQLSAQQPVCTVLGPSRREQ